MAPNGLIAHLYGPLEGKRHDAFMLGVSGLLPQLERITKPDGEPSMETQHMEYHAIS